jgi:hypothetical protein
VFAQRAGFSNEESTEAINVADMISERVGPLKVEYIKAEGPNTLDNTGADRLILKCGVGQPPTE